MRSTVVGLPPTGAPYSHAIVASGRLVFLAGQVGRGRASGDLAAGDIYGQTRAALDNMRTVLEAAGASLSDVVRVLAFLAPGVDRQRFNEAYREYFSEDGAPVRTTVHAELAPSLLVELEAIAVLPE